MSFIRNIDKDENTAWSLIPEQLSLKVPVQGEKFVQLKSRTCIFAAILHAIFQFAGLGHVVKIISVKKVCAFCVNRFA